ncbi:hypothetical protein [Profundibacter sp.]
MKRIIGAIVLALGLNACTTYEAVEEAVVIEEPASVEPVAGSLKSDCSTTDTDDGIGGTGCKVVD